LSVKNRTKFPSCVAFDSAIEVEFNTKSSAYILIIILSNKSKLIDIFNIYIINIYNIFLKVIMALEFWEQWHIFTSVRKWGSRNPEVVELTSWILSWEIKEWSPKLPERYKHIHSGKVRETFEHPDNPKCLIMIATDRISTHDVIHKGLIEWKWKALTHMANYWFKYFAEHKDTDDIPNQLSNTQFPEDFPPELLESSVVVKKLTALPIEAIVRWYMYGSALKGYNEETWELATWEFVWIGLTKCSKFSKALFTPSTKSDSWDINITFDSMVQVLNEWLHIQWFQHLSGIIIAAQIEQYSLNMYNAANNHAQEKWLVFWDTKFEFWLDSRGKLHVIDEVCTADSSRLWEAQSVVEWDEPIAKDKQPVRDYVADYWKENPEQNKQAVQIIELVREVTAKRYKEISEIFS